ncbi:hypothetical protein RclHR1_25800002 [Rhizophagus clarus]|uniref:C2H2-type domain-containing protein n=1 Tax=Rhizophagus clarus TaxID=94130 RepID=A0A2Z6QZN6_9GLOM|nr:hypothetical protein RclHR1_25800002 [Rhizophagus clarus]
MILKQVPAYQPKQIEKIRQDLERSLKFEVTGEELDLPLNLKECQRLHHDLLQADDKAFKENIPQEVGPSEVKRQDAQEQDAIPKKSDHNIDTFVKDVADYSFLKELGMIEETETEELAEYFEGMKKIASIEDHVPEGDIHFEEGLVGRDLERPHQNWSLMSKWKAKVLRRSNPAYAFNDMVERAKKYKKIPYMLKLIASARQEMTRVFQTDEKWHREEIQALFSENYIDEHFTSSGGEIDKKIEEYLENGSNWILVRIDIVYIEVYTYSQATGGSYEPTPKKLANTKCTINPDNKGLIDSETNALSEKCLQDALGCYFAHQDKPDIDHLERIFWATKLKPYLDVVKLDGIPMPTPICLRIFNKIEEMNPDISINVWEWKEETATPKPVIASKNIYIPNSCKIENCKHNNLNKCQEKRIHVIHLMALTNITKSEEKKYGQKNHFLWIKNPNGLVFKDTAYHGEKHLCNRCFQSFPSENTLVHHQEHCFGLGEATQRVDLPVKGVNDFEQFKNYGRMINAPCVIIADFEAGNKKPGLINGGKPRIISEQYANSFCYLVHWIDTGDHWLKSMLSGTYRVHIKLPDMYLICVKYVYAI